MTAGEHEMPPHLARYLDGLGDPGKVAEPPDMVATTGDGVRLTVTPGYDVDQIIDATGESRGIWAGSAAAKLGLTGEVDPDAVRALYHHPDTVVDLAPVTAEAVGTTSAPAEASQKAGHVDPAAAARWHQAQTELVGLIHRENRILGQDPEARRLLPDSLGDWMENRVAELEQAEASEPEIDPLS